MKRTEFKQQVCKKFQEVAFVNNKMINQFTVDWLIDIMAEVITDGLIRDGVFSIRDIVKITVTDGKATRNYYNPNANKVMEYTPKKKIKVKLGKSIVSKINEVVAGEEN